MVFTAYEANIGREFNFFFYRALQFTFFPPHEVLEILGGGGVVVCCRVTVLYSCRAQFHDKMDHLHASCTARMDL